MNKLIVANWKMNPVSLLEAVALAKESDKAGVVIAPPFVFLQAVKEVLVHAALAAQDVFFENAPVGGAYTGEVSANMLKLVGAKYVIVGHSERRAYILETDEMVGRKVEAVVTSDLTPILCVGEGSITRKEGMEQAKQFVANQLFINLQFFKRSAKSACVIAYEPLWAIGTGENDSPLNAAEMSRHIKQIIREQFNILNSLVLYGGSVNGKNIEAFAHESDIDGFLIGGASLHPEEFKKIIEIVSNIS
ncbi:MAG: triose-phosphate isomerase [Candidatus Paceibacterota bacterium]|jgi:triosephosphate isomerase